VNVVTKSPEQGFSLTLDSRFRQARRRRDDVLRAHFFRVLQQADLHFFFGFEVRKQAAFRHANLIRQHAERDALQAALAHQREALVENSLARGYLISYVRRIARPDLEQIAEETELER
jgi:hypothetical protein